MCRISMDEKYQRIKVLGKGSFGKAYLVKNTEADELCVVKQMETSMMNKTEREEAVKEAMLLKRMDHKNIVRFQEVFMTRKGRLCIVMDYADGGDVHMELKRQVGQLLKEAQILEWFAQTCFALKHVHERKVLHRDLKTQNIFLMATGQIKLGDFGIARVLDATKDYAKTMVGTPYYLSPEIIQDKPYNFKSDIWSLGVVLYEMTTLKHPFDADSLVILAGKILKDQAPPPDAMYSANLVALIRTMLNKDAQVRPVVKDVLKQGFLFPAMTEANEKYQLDMDLSEFAKAPEPAPADSPCHAKAGEQPEGKRQAGEEEYDEDFEDMSEPEDNVEDKPETELSKSVANLKLHGITGAPAGSPPKGHALDSVAEEEQEAQEAQPSAIAPGVSDLKGASGSVAGVAAKAASLRAYLQGQMPASDFDKAYAVVRSSGEVTAMVLQKRVGDVIGADKAPELFTLFQLLCFLEDVSAHPEQEAA